MTEYKSHNTINSSKIASVRNVLGKLKFQTAFGWKSEMISPPSLLPLITFGTVKHKKTWFGCRELKALALL